MTQTRVKNLYMMQYHYWTHNAWFIDKYLNKGPLYVVQEVLCCKDQVIIEKQAITYFDLITKFWRFP